MVNRHIVKTATQVAYEYLRERILSGDFPGGTRIDLDAVAGAVGASRMPVRDAVRQLNTEGLLTIFPRRGVTVTSLSVDDVMELFETRSVLEGLAVRCGMVLITAGELKRLCEMVDRLEAWHGDPARYLKMHDEFHEYLCGQSRRPRLLASIRALREAVEPYIRLFLKLHGHEMGGTLHRPIVDAIAEGDGAAAEEAVRAHVVAGGTGLVEFLKTSGAVHER